MSEAINWIHLSDLHLGIDGDSWLWPRFKHDLFRDIDRISHEVDGWDIVFFTGDLVQTGGSSEYDALNKELDLLWKKLTKNDRAPKLCVIPGNHDLSRPDPDGAITKALSQLWKHDEKLRKKFWKEGDCEYRKAVESYFSNYQSWLNNASVPLLQRKAGILPGDFSATFPKGAVTLGIVGLNSTFLQIANGNMRGLLDLHVSQLNSVCEGDPEAWVNKHTFNVLLTHQPSSWFTPEAFEHFRQEIYPPGRFFSHLCGHQHEPESFELTEAGALPRRLRQGPSLFGLETWQGPTPKQRTHGYNAGQFVFDDNGSYERLWPRVAIQGRHGGLNLSPDHSYVLREGDFVLTPIDLSKAEDANSSETKSDDSAESEPSTESTVQLLEKAPNEASAKLDLAFCPRMPIAVTSQHRYVRLDEQSQCENELRKSRALWLVADWGAGEEGFLGTVLDRFRTENTKPEAFHLRCDEASDIESFEALFPQQFGMALQPFCHLINSLKDSFLILDGVHSDLSSGAQFDQLQRIVNAVVDYCPSLKITIISRFPPPAITFQTVSLRPLDAPDVRTYITNHTDATSEVKDSDAVEKLYERSEGLPMHLDRMLKSLKVTSLPSVLEAELEGTAISSSDEVPIGLVQTVSKLSNSQDKRSKRSFRLLKVLSVLPYGETLDSLVHFLPTEPFFLENALQLNELTLLDVVPLQKASLQVKTHATANSDTGLPKLLKVPRQVRDYVQALLSDEERYDIVLAGIEKFFGRSWREGRIKIRTRPIEYREYLSSGAGNEFALIHNLISHARTAGDESMIRKGSELGVRYARHLKGQDRYRDLTIVAGALTQLLDRDEQAEEWARLASLFAEGLRMTGKHEECLKYCNDALEFGKHTLSDSEKASIWLECALAEERMNNSSAAIAAANEVIRYSKQNSGTYLHASSILSGLTLKGSERIRALRDLESKARSDGFKTLANTIVLDFARNAESPESEIKHLDKVLSSKNDGYNQTRAIVAKSKAVLKKKKPGQLDSADLLTLSSAYSYLHAQRFSSLFDQCHEQLWKIFESRGNSAQLLRLFRHSSFIWRIRGEDKKEAEYLRRLEKRDVDRSEQNSDSLGMEIVYFLRRLKFVMPESSK